MQDTAIARAVTGSARYPVLDALRFILAFWVVMGHFGVVPLFAAVSTRTWLGRTLVHGWSSLVFGTPAVIGFFVISGFCIHLPFRRASANLAIGRYYARRYTRILIPLGAGLLVFRYAAGMKIQLLGNDSILWYSVLWSLACEEIYYAVYPLLRLLRNRLGWKWLLGGAFLLAAAVSFTHRYAGDWRIYGPVGAALILLPIWLLGCVLAEEVETLTPNRSAFNIWFWRFSAWFGSWACEMLFFKFKIAYTHTMILFGIVAYFWIKNEIAHGLAREPWKFLVSFGAWSYSLYLIHPAADFMYARLRMPNLGAIPNWCLLFGFILCTSYLFYLLVELPSHRMARKIRLVEKPTARLVEQNAAGVPAL